jgi:ABC-type multidrug transport system permease subunit
VEAPLNVLPCVIFACIIYWIVGLNPSTFGYHILILMLEVLTAISLGLCISAATPNIEAANALGPIIVVISLIFGGFYSTFPIQFFILFS